ncbi:hypothetical protein EX30DRAFT_396492 [Ascodesmis nigricans]|uniref:RNI-like protein n=1 Tax=Ascodesmis nigricans TaxID=341454 RepID=A0A4S2MUJ0_9PEZI|nr:hypothetical protein EX30DRAFT_396492 [Ascodesmis nigricans]
MLPKRYHPSTSTTTDPILSNYTRFLSYTQVGDDGTPFLEHTSTATFTPLPQLQYRGLPFAFTVPRDNEDGEDTGACSLAWYARKVLNEHLEQMTPEILRAVPWEIGRWIWEDAVKTNSNNLHLWSTFHLTYPLALTSPLLLPTATLSLPPYTPLHHLLPLLPTFPGVHYLDLRDHPSLDTNTLLTLPTQLPTLHTLRFNTPLLTDSILRSWACSGKLKQLRELEVRWANIVTERVLEYVSWMPGLVRVDLTGCELGEGWGVRAREWGWGWEVGGKGVREFEEVVGEMYGDGGGGGTCDNVIPGATSAAGDIFGDGSETEQRLPILHITPLRPHRKTPPTTPLSQTRIFSRTLSQARTTAQQKRSELARAERAAMLAARETKRAEMEGVGKKVLVREKRRVDVGGLLEEFASAGKGKRGRR